MKGYNANLTNEVTKQYGLMIGEVVSESKDDISGKDAKKRNRVRVRVLGITPSKTPDNECLWAETSALLMGGKKGSKSSACSFSLEKGTFVYLMFLDGNISHPVILGVVRGKEDVSKKYEEESQVIETLSGHLIKFIDKNGKESIEIRHGKKKTSIVFDKEGTLQIEVEKDLIINVKGKSNITVDGDTMLKTKKATIDCDELKVTGDAKFDKTIKAVGLITSDDDVKASAISLKQHKHGGVSTGGGTTSPSIP